MQNYIKLLLSLWVVCLIIPSIGKTDEININLEEESLFRAVRNSDGSIGLHPKYVKPPMVGSGETQDDSGENKDDSADTKDESDATKDESTDTKDDSAGTKDDSAGTKDDSAGTKDDSTDAKDDSTDTKDDSADTKDDSVGTKDDSTSKKDNDGNKEDDGAGRVTTKVRKIFQVDKEKPDSGPVWNISPVTGQPHLLTITDVATQHSVIISVPDDASWNFEETSTALGEPGPAQLPTFNIFNSICDPATLELIHQALQQAPVGWLFDLRAWRCLSAESLKSMGRPVTWNANPAPIAPIQPDSSWQYSDSHFQVHVSLTAAPPQPAAPEAGPESATVEDGASTQPAEGETDGDEPPPAETVLTTLAIATYLPDDTETTEVSTNPVTITLPGTYSASNLHVSNPATTGGDGGSGTEKDKPSPTLPESGDSSSSPTAEDKGEDKEGGSTGSHTGEEGKQTSMMSWDSKPAVGLVLISAMFFTANQISSGSGPGNIYRGLLVK